MLDVPVTYAEAALGASVEIPTPDGPVSLKVPGRHGEREAPPRQGPRRAAPEGNGRGDLLARVKVTVPKKLTKAEREALEGYQKVVRAREPRAALRGGRAR